MASCLALKTTGRIVSLCFNSARKLSSKVEPTLTKIARNRSKQKRTDFKTNGQHKSGVVGVRQAKKYARDPDAEFMKLWAATETHMKEMINEAVKGTPPRAQKSSWQQQIASLPLESELPEENYDELPDDDESVSFRVPGVDSSTSYSQMESSSGFSGLRFQQLGVHPKLVEKLHSYGIETPTVIQQKSLPLIFGGKNVVIQSETGSGKTLVFLLPAVQDPGRGCGTVIIVPTRELASQMLYEAHCLLRDKSIITSLVSGVDLGEQQKRLQDKAHPPRIVIATPKKLLEVVQNNRELFKKTRRIVIDEVDKSLAPLHRRASRKALWSRAVHPKPAAVAMKELKRISRVAQIQLIAASATVNEMLKEDLRDLGWGDHVTLLQPPSYDDKLLSIPPCISHKFVNCNLTFGITKAQILVRIFHKSGQKSALVFIHRSQSVDLFVEELCTLGIKAVALYKEVSSQDPVKFEQFLYQFRSGDIQIVVGTEETVRGLDFKELNHVYLTEVPRNVDEYVHLAGRVGRQGHAGTATTLVSSTAVGEERRICLHYRRLGVPYDEIVLDN